MTVIQPKEFNQYVECPLTWSDRWNMLKWFSPIVFVTVILVFETGLLNAWLYGTLGERLPMILVSPVIVLGSFVVALETVIHVHQRSRRILKLGQRSLSVQPARFGGIPWKRLVEFHFEPVTGHPLLTKLTIIYQLQRKLYRSWSIIITDRKSHDELLTHLERQNNTNKTQFKITHCAQPLPPKAKPKRKLELPVFLFAAALFLYIHGAPLLIAGLTHNNGSSASSTPERLSPSAEKFLLQHFKTAEDLRSCLVRTGFIFTTSALALYAWSLWLWRRAAKSRPDDRIQLSLGPASSSS